jgi:hypothetical protein
LTPVVSSIPACNGDVTYTWTYTDCIGNTHDYVHTVTITRTTHPSVPTDGASNVQCSSLATDPGAPTNVYDVCGNHLIGQYKNTTTTGTSCNGTKTYTYTFTDCANLSTDWNFVYTILDNTKPGITAPIDQTVSNQTGYCSATVSVGTATGTANCTENTVTITGTRNDAQALTAAYPVGTTTITWKAIDNCGNFSTKDQFITVNDDQAPTFTLVPSNMTVCSGSSATWATPTATDNCVDPTVTLTSGYGSGYVFTSGTTNTVTYTATDGHNTTTISFTVYVYEPLAVASIADQYITKNNAVTFTATASGADHNYHYNWYKTGSSTVIGTGSSYSINSVQCSNEGGYRVDVTSTLCGGPVSQSCSLYVYEANPPAAASNLAMKAANKNYISMSVTIPSTNTGANNYRMIVAQNELTATSTDVAASHLTWTPEQGHLYTSSEGTFLFTESSSPYRLDNHGGNGVYTQLVYNGQKNGTASVNWITVNGLTRYQTQYVFAVFEYVKGADGCVNRYQTSDPIKLVQKTSPKQSEGDEPFSIQLADNFIMSDVSPNPTSNDINFTLSVQENLPFTIEIFSVEGMKVYSEQRDISSGSTPITISLKSEKGTLPNGMYLLKVRTGSDELTRRIIYMP